MKRASSGSPIVELLGLPGAGKSTAIQRIEIETASSTQTEWSNAYNQSRLLPPTMALFLRAPWVHSVLYVLFIMRGASSGPELRRVASVTRRYLSAKAGRTTPTFFDEGPLHALFVGLYGTRRRRGSDVLLRWAVRMLSASIDIFIWLDVPRGDCVANFLRPGRSSARFNETTSADEIQTFLHDRSYEAIVEALAQSTASKVIRLPTVDEVVRFASEVPVPWRPGTEGPFPPQ